jgi:predicted class III extradiol MEMO1 family dioxygenase
VRLDDRPIPAFRAMSALPPIRYYTADIPDFGFVPIVLKKSDFTSDRNFAEALVRWHENYVGDLIISPPFNGRLS